MVDACSQKTPLSEYGESHLFDNSVVNTEAGDQYCVNASSYGTETDWNSCQRARVILRETIAILDISPVRFLSESIPFRGTMCRPTTQPCPETRNHSSAPERSG